MRTLANTGRYYYSWGSAQMDAPPLGVAHASQSTPPVGYMPGSMGTILGKRPREDAQDGDYVQMTQHNSTRGPPKRAKRKMLVNRVLEAAGSTSRTNQKPVTMTLTEKHGKFEAAGRGAGMLAAPNAHEVYHEFLPGPSVQQELVVTTAQGELPWIEGSAEEATLNHSSSVVQQQGVVNDANDGEREEVEARNFKIPRRLSQRQIGLLEATPADLARGTVHVLKCRLCPDTGLGSWEDYRRHCDLAEAHPLKLTFCNYCGDFFARTDSLGRHLARHRRNRTAESQGAMSDEVRAKQMATAQVHEEFEALLKRYLETNEEIGDPFAQRIKAMFPNSSKKGNR
jgi:hypothetical protein